MRHNPLICLALLGAAGSGCLTEKKLEGVEPPAPEGSEEQPPPPPPYMGPLDLGPTVHQQDPPPPISGGTLAVTDDGSLAVAADPDRDLVYLVGLESAVPRLRTVELRLHDEPGRVALDGSRRAWVALRRGGSIAVTTRQTDPVPATASASVLSVPARLMPATIACGGGVAEGAAVGRNMSRSVVPVSHASVSSYEQASVARWR